MKRVLMVLCKGACVVFAFVFLAVLLVDRNVAYYLHDKNVPLLPNCALAALVLVVGAGGLFWHKKAHRPAAAHAKEARQTSWVERHYTALCIVLPIMVFVFLLGVFASVHLVTRWDAGILRDAAMTPVGSWSNGQLYYYGRYPNNLFLLGILHALCALSTRIVPFVGCEAALALCSALLAAVSCFFFMRAAKKIMGTAGGALAASVLFIVLAGMSPWALIPYSDSFGLFFCTALLWCFACGKNAFTKWFLPGLLAMVGYAIKPTVLFAFVAWIVARILADGAALRRVKQLGIVAACIAGGLAIGFLCVRGTTNSLHMELDSNIQITMPHFVMMGLNDQTDGSYYREDVDYSDAQPNVQAREQANWERAQERLQAFGPAGLANHLLRKLLLTFNDGTFAWGQEGHFFDNSFVANLPTSDLVASYYLDTGTGYAVFCTVQQVLWLITLAGVPLGFLGIGALADEKCARQLALIATMLASLVALTFFLLVCEPRARYLYLYGGYFVLLAAWGYQQLWHRVWA